MRRNASRPGALALIAAAVGVTGCSGDSNGDVPVNSAPVFSSAATASVMENPTAAYLAAASDTQGDPISYTIAGGADAASFAIGADGRLTFVTAPNYDLPTDANADNVYQVKIQASDGKASSTLDVAITVTNSREDIHVGRLAHLAGAVAIVSFEESGIEGSPNLLVAFENGAIFHMDRADGSLSSYARLTGFSDNLKVLGITRARATTEGPRVATYVLAQDGTQVWMICLGCLNSPTGSISGKVANVTDGSPVAIGTGPDGFAYVAIGDLAGTHAQTVQNDDRQGKLYRYSMDPDPYASASLPEDFFIRRLVGLGLRAPAGVTALQGTRLLISDRGESAFDELSMVWPLAPLNFGWPYYEGRQERRAGSAGLSGMVNPQLVIARGSGQRQSRGIVGGVAYGGPIAGIKNHYVFADKDGRIWSIPFDKLLSAPLDSAALEVRDEDFAPDTSKIDHPISMTVPAMGRLYILDADGDLFQVHTAEKGSVVITSPKT